MQRLPVAHTYEQPGAYRLQASAVVIHPETGESVAGVYEQMVEVLSPSIHAAFSYAPETGGAPLTVQFTDQSTTTGATPIDRWHWSFGDFVASTEQNPQHVFQEIGTYTVVLTVYAGEEQAGTYHDVVVTGYGPKADFGATPSSGPAPLTVQFTDASAPGTSDITSWAWDFGDGTTSTLQSPAHTYTEPGTYTVGLTVTTALGHDDEVKTGLITVSSPTPTVYDDFNDNDFDQTVRWQVVAGTAPVENNGLLDLSSSDAQGHRIDARTSGYRLVQAKVSCNMNYGQAAGCLQARWVQSAGDTLAAQLCLVSTSTTLGDMTLRAQTVNDTTGTVVLVDEIAATTPITGYELRLGYDPTAQRIDFIVDDARLAYLSTASSTKLASGWGSLALTSESAATDYGYFYFDDVTVGTYYASPP